MGAAAFAYVALGGALGASARFSISTALGPASPAGFPVAILGINILGSFLIGVFAALLVSKGAADPWKLFLVPGLLGGFTTFSTFSLEALGLLSRGAFGAAALYIGLSVLGALAATALGWAIIRGGFA
ncbi:MAG: fluoride efflux transporter CrcB [Pseudomonadota bacterium]